MLVFVPCRRTFQSISSLHRSLIRMDSIVSSAVSILEARAVLQSAEVQCCSDITTRRVNKKPVICYAVVVNTNSILYYENPIAAD